MEKKTGEHGESLGGWEMRTMEKDGRRKRIKKGRTEESKSREINGGLQKIERGHG